MKKNRNHGVPSPLSEILRAAFVHNGWNNRLQRADVWRSWEDVAGREIALHAWPERFQGDTLIVKVSDSIWMQQLSFIKHEILGRLNARFPARLQFKNIRFELGDVEALRSLWMPKDNDIPSKDKKGAKESDAEPWIMERASDIVKEIRDKELADCLRRLHIKYLTHKNNNQP
ncbi:MAG: DUF721 domain-containing protein [Dissulfurimicrobium sp.]|uniref:DUF721 domain-containing protein n=1 Tax=Dissulfurimicrobium sp. TaxID=2022436 RepID=UPI00404B1DAE